MVSRSPCSTIEKPDANFSRAENANIKQPSQTGQELSAGNENSEFLGNNFLMLGDQSATEDVWVDLNKGKAEGQFPLDVFCRKC